MELDTITLDQHAVFEFDSPGLAELVKAGGNNYCFNDFCGNNACAQAVCAQALCVDARVPSRPQNLLCPPSNYPLTN